MTLPCSLMIYLLKYWCICIGMFNYQYRNISEVLATNQPSKHVKNCWCLKLLLQKWLCFGGPSMATMASVCCSDCFFSSSAWPNKNSGPNQPPILGVLPPALQQNTKECHKKKCPEVLNGKGHLLFVRSIFDLTPLWQAFSSSSKEIRFWSSCWIIAVKAVALSSAGSIPRFTRTAGWWLGLPLWKIWKSLGMMNYSQYMGK